MTLVWLAAVGLGGLWWWALGWAVWVLMGGPGW